MSFQEAEEWKLDNPFSSMEKEEFKGKEEVNNLLLEIIQELTQLMGFFESMCKDKRIGYILLLGGGSLMPICKKYIENALQVETEYLFALHSIYIKELHSANHISFLANAIGALVRREKNHDGY
jgi:Tfp pilus assembly PilM family ATPase